MKKICLFIAIFFAIQSSFAQEGGLDTGFNIPANTFTGDGVTCIVRDNTGNIYAAGYFSSSPLQATVKKFSATGTLLSFPLGSFGMGSIASLVVLSDNSLLIGGNFTYSTKSSIIKVSSTGVLDTSFTCNLPTVTSGFFLNTMAVQPGTGRILVGGAVSTVQSTIKAFYGLTPTGSIDSTFNSGGSGIAGTDNTISRIVNSISTFPNGEIIIGGLFSTYNGSPRINIAKLTSAGGLNLATFAGINYVSDGFTGVYSTTIDNSGRVLVGGNFSHSSGKHHLVRYSSGGVFDTGFTAPLQSLNTNIIFSIAVQCTNKIVIGGMFTGLTSSTAYNIARLNDNGNLDTTFNPGTGTGPEYVGGSESIIEDLILDVNNDIYIGGTFSQYNSTNRNNIAKIKGTAIIVTNPDTVNTTLSGGANIYNVISNDTYNGGAIATGMVTVTQLTANSQISISSTGQVTVSNPATPGQYTINYQVCPTSSTTCQCVTGTLTVNISQPIDAVNDAWTIYKTCPITVNVLGNDTHGSSPATTGNVTISGTESYNYLTFDPVTGNITTTSSIAVGTYTFTYTICSTISPTSCDTATVTINVVAEPAINAVSDIGTYMVMTGTATTFPVSILNNDTLGGLPLSAADVTITTPYYIPPGITINTTTGIISVSGDLAPGYYGFTYTICHTGGCKCDSAIAQVFVLGHIDAIDDFASTNAGTAITIPTLNNDIYEGGSANGLNVIITGTSGLPAGFTFDMATGEVVVPAITPAGIYTFTYTICDAYSNNTNCDTATVTIIVLNPGTGLSGGPVHAIEVQTNGYILLGGEFTSFDGVPRNKILRLKDDLTLDLSFDIYGIGFNDVVRSISMQGSKILVAGDFTATTNAIVTKCLARLNSDGTLDSNFANNNFYSLSETTTRINCVKVLPDNSILVGGNFNTINSNTGTSKYKIAKLSVDGIPNSSYISPITLPAGSINDILINSDQTLIVGGENLYINGSYKSLYKATLTGSYDSVFTMGIANGGGSAINSIAKTNGKLIVAGNFTTYNGVSIKNIAQISTAGLLDNISVFNPGLSANTFIRSVVVDPTTYKIIIGGNFNSINNNATNQIARLNTNGGFDGSFIIGSAFGTSDVLCLKFQTDFKLLVGGSFGYFNGNPANCIARLVLSNPVVQGRYMDPETTTITRDIKIYPNPSTGLFNIDLTGYDNAQFEVAIYNTLGQLIHKGNIAAQNSNRIDLTAVQKGNYFITLQNSHETINRIITIK